MIFQSAGEQRRAQQAVVAKKDDHLLSMSHWWVRSEASVWRKNAVNMSQLASQNFAPRLTATKRRSRLRRLRTKIVNDQIHQTDTIKLRSKDDDDVNDEMSCLVAARDMAESRDFLCRFSKMRSQEGDDVKEVKKSIVHQYLQNAHAMTPEQKDSQTRRARRPARRAPTWCGGHLARSMWLPLFLLIATLLTINQPNQVGAQASTDVIPTFSTASDTASRQTQELLKRPQQAKPEPSSHAGHRFKYHLNHLQPPSPVPITIQQADPTTIGATHSAAGQTTTTTTSGANRAAHNFSAADNPHSTLAANATLSRDRRNLVQLHLPLQLHLKLKPLPLPMPPPAPAQPTNHADRVERKCGLLDSGCSTTTTTTTTTSTPSPITDSKTGSLFATGPATAATENELPVAHSTSGGGGRGHDLLAFAWREAKRVLLLSSMAPAMLQAQFERRFADLSTEASATSASQTPGAPATTPTSTATATSVLARDRLDSADGGGSLAEQVSRQDPQPGELVGEQTGEVRRQRHNSQQPQSSRYNSLTREGNDDSQVQAMAAAMLPLFWPSFQLGAHHRAGASLISESPATPVDAGWSIKYTQLDRNLNGASGRQQSAASVSNKIQTELPTAKTITKVDHHPQVSSPPTRVAIEGETKTVLEIDQEPVKVRAKRRKPSYLSQVSSTPYPESIRLASKYPLPKIKFQPQQTSPTVSSQKSASSTSVQPSLPMTTAVAAASGKRTAQQPESTNNNKSIVPKSLSRLIEHQLLTTNATSLLEQYRASGPGGLAPSTSVSKVVRFKNATEQMQVVQIQPEVAKNFDAFDLYRSKPFDLTRQPAFTGEFPAVSSTTTMMPIVVPTTTSATRPRLHKNAEMRTKHPRPITTTTTTTTTTIPPPTTTTTQRPDTTTRVTHLRLRQATTTTTTTTTTTSTTTSRPASATTTTTADPSPITTLPSRTGRRRPKGKSGTRPTEPSGPYRALPAPATTTTGAPVPADESEGSNKVLPEEDDETSLERSAGRAARLNKAKRRPGESVTARSGSERNIKLFHFKRKPDMKKLPFYKKPLNYTELGWTPEQIQEHLANQAATSEAAESSSATASEVASGEPSGGLQDSAPAATTSVGQQEVAESRQKRRPRGKNHFERLMAELRAGDSATVDENKPEPSARGEEGARGEGEDGGGGDNDGLVPVMKRKTEPLVMKPMFTVMHQQKRRAQQQSANNTPAPEVTTTQVGALATELSNVTVGEKYSPLDEEQQQKQQVANNRSKPIIRKRRKQHASEHPAFVGQLLSQSSAASEEFFTGSGDQQQWRPSKPLGPSGGWEPAAPFGSDRLLLIPSGLLTPSGSHLMPLFAGGAQQESGHQPQLNEEQVGVQPVVVGEQDTWRPTATHQWREPIQSEMVAPFADLGPKPSGGLAPSGEESFLQAPGGPSTGNSMGPSQAIKPLQALANQQQAQQMPQQQTELKVPKLLVKPMRPAKYSLNGYIPKPSLAQQQQQQQQPAASLQSETPKLQPSSPIGSPAISSNSLKPKLRSLVPGIGLINSKDLESANSNKVFSRRRGLQLHQRSVSSSTGGAGAGGGKLSFQSLLGNDKQSPVSEQSIRLKQLEENKRKYLVQPTRAPTLSVHKANLIKAKLGLIAAPPSNQVQTSSDVKDSAQAASGLDNKLASEQQALASGVRGSAQALDDALKDKLGQPLVRDRGGGQSTPLVAGAAAPLNSIPKTDFECTDSKGKFVAGLFADQKTGCQVWHLCSNNRKYSFLCPSGTIFNAKLRICDWRYNVRC